MENIRTRTKKEVGDASLFAITKFAKDLLETSGTSQRDLLNTLPCPCSIIPTTF
jgi:molecular chaperone GrpE (heat shock protein)